MSIPLSPSGLNLPQNPDTGATFWADLEAAIQLLNDHTHSGSDSSSLAKSQNILAAGWGADLGGGTRKQTVVLPGALVFDTITMEFRLASTREIIYPRVEKVSATTYDIYTNDPSLQLVAVYI
jgi:hypothetical protein